MTAAASPRAASSAVATISCVRTVSSRPVVLRRASPRARTIEPGSSVRTRNAWLNQTRPARAPWRSSMSATTIRRLRRRAPRSRTRRMRPRTVASSPSSTSASPRTSERSSWRNGSDSSMSPTVSSPSFASGPRSRGATSSGCRRRAGSGAVRGRGRVGSSAAAKGAGVTAPARRAAPPSGRRAPGWRAGGRRWPCGRLAPRSPGCGAGRRPRTARAARAPSRAARSP